MRWLIKLIQQYRLAALGAIGGIVLALFLIQGLRATADAPAPAAASRTTSPAEPDIQGYGFSTDLAHLEPDELEERLEDIKATGATWVRYDLSWNVVQAAGPASFDWSEPDRITSAIQAQGLHALPVVGLAPAWARLPQCAGSELCAPRDAGAYAAFVKAAAEHYAPAGVHTWEIWNEPNISYRFRPATNPAQYAVMLKGAYTAIKRVDPQATVVAASTAPTASDASNLRPLDFVQALYTAGAQGYFDAISAHPYTYPLTPAQSNPSDAWGQLTAMHGVMAAHGDGAKRIWITEFGAPTNGPNLAGDHITEAAQAQTVREAVKLFRELSWSGPLLWYDYQDPSNNTASSEYFYGLVRADGSRKPAYEAFVEAVR